MYETCVFHQLQIYSTPRAIAHKYHLSDLRKLALQALKRELTAALRRVAAPA